MSGKKEETKELKEKPTQEKNCAIRYLLFRRSEEVIGSLSRCT